MRARPGSSKAALSVECRKALMERFASDDCMGGNILMCTTETTFMVEWQLLCHSGAIQYPSAVLQPEVLADTAPDWQASILGGIAEYEDLWTPPTPVYLASVGNNTAADVLSSTAGAGPVTQGIITYASAKSLLGYVLHLADSEIVNPAVKVRRMHTHQLRHIRSCAAGPAHTHTHTHTHICIYIYMLYL